jgi:hypothetical protein
VVWGGRGEGERGEGDIEREIGERVTETVQRRRDTGRGDTGEGDRGGGESYMWG